MDAASFIRKDIAMNCVYQSTARYKIPDNTSSSGVRYITILKDGGISFERYDDLSYTYVFTDNKCRIWSKYEIIKEYDLVKYLYWSNDFGGDSLVKGEKQFRLPDNNYFDRITIMPGRNINPPNDIFGIRIKTNHRWITLLDNGIDIPPD